MKYGIISAMKEEAEIIIKKYNLKQTKNYQNISFFENNNMVLVLAGIGKIQASIATTLLIKDYGPKQIVNVGIAGNTGLEKRAKIGDIFLITKVYQHDGYLPFEGEHLDYFKQAIKLNTSEIQVDGFNIFNGVCATGDQFIDDERIIEYIIKKTKAHVVEMEAFAVAATCREFDKLNDLIIIKAVSDGADSDSIKTHMENLDIAMENSIKVLDKIIV